MPVAIGLANPEATQSIIDAIVKGRKGRGKERKRKRGKQKYTK